MAIALVSPLAAILFAAVLAFWGLKSPAGSLCLKSSPIRNVAFTPHQVPLDCQSTCPGGAHSDPGNRLSKAEARYRGQVHGPESLAFDPSGCGPYASIADGRVMRRRCDLAAQDDATWRTGSGSGWDDGARVDDVWETFALTSADRNASCGSGSGWEDVCGRPLGIRFNKRTGDLYIADAYKGLQKVGPQGGVAETLLTEVEGQPMMFTNDLDIDSDGFVYLTDSSDKYRRRQYMLELAEAGPYGRLIKYDPSSGVAQVLMRGLRFANGVSLSRDESYLLVCETTVSRIHRFWLKGAKAGTSEVFAHLPGYPDNIRRGRIAATSGVVDDNGNSMASEGGDFFWVAIHTRRMAFISWLQRQPWLRTALLSLSVQVPVKKTALILGLDGDGNVVEVLEDVNGRRVTTISEVEERVIYEKQGDERSIQRRELWLGSVINDYIGVYTL
ncbi:hypothetical protein CBR_g3702 [Chara braunii]|uniref:Strictosidine synthase conserved region domain-containing protein n=1 Tax=Chara braunii TaxID=69332 RepID=A0A388KGA2_CHABU|nr:hypothetical protein CBR_g3702 [Chara braunii]|eukprot:GBG69003.1 hypothetical protein CBR_g3702 [Chara braunii]